MFVCVSVSDLGEADQDPQVFVSESSKCTEGIP